MDKKFIKKHFLTEFCEKFEKLSNVNEDSPATRKNKRSNEWSFVPNYLDEEGEDDENNNMNDIPTPNQGNDMSNGDDNGQEPLMPTDDNNQGEQGLDNQQPPMRTDDNKGGEITDIPSPNMNTDTEEETDSDDEVDVTELTDAQEKMNKKISSVGKDIAHSDETINKLMQSLDKISDIIKSNDAKIAELQREIQKRNPTPLEKLDLRSVETSTPYNVRPNDFWNKKLQTLPNYTSYDENSDNEGKKEYVITQGDVDNFTDAQMENSLKDLELDFDKIFGLK